LTDSSAWISNIAFVSRNQVDVQMINTPAGHSSLVDADGIAAWAVSGGKFFFDCAHEGVRVNDFGFAQIEERLDMALRYNFGVSGCRGKLSSRA
jgi:hypothetical protein